jgi:hypothetical protein
MLEVIKALVKKLEETPSLWAGMTGEFWTRRAPPSVARPYIIIEPGGGEADYDTSKRYVKDNTFRILFIGDNLSDFAHAVKRIRDALNFQPLTLESGRLMQATVVSDDFIDEPPPNDESANCHHVLTVEFKQQHSHQ